MNANQSGADIWEKQPKVAAEISPEARRVFVAGVVNRVHRRVAFYDFMGLIFMGFGGVLLGFLKLGNKPEVEG